MKHEPPTLPNRNPHAWHEIPVLGLVCLQCPHCGASIALVISVTCDGRDWHVQILKPGTPPLQMHEAQQVMHRIRHTCEQALEREERRHCTRPSDHCYHEDMDTLWP